MGILEKAKAEFIASKKGVAYKPGIPADVKPPLPKKESIPVSAI